MGRASILLSLLMMSSFNLRLASLRLVWLVLQAMVFPRNVVGLSEIFLVWPSDNWKVAFGKTEPLWTIIDTHFDGFKYNPRLLQATST
jgi:hypothetical protein